MKDLSKLNSYTGIYALNSYTGIYTLSFVFHTLSYTVMFYQSPKALKPCCINIAQCMRNRAPICNATALLVITYRRYRTRTRCMLQDELDCRPMSSKFERLDMCGSAAQHRMCMSMIYTASDLASTLLCTFAYE